MLASCMLPIYDNVVDYVILLILCSDEPPGDKRGIAPWVFRATKVISG